MPYTVAQDMASCIDAMHHCQRRGNTEWAIRHERRAIHLCREFMPSGSGFDAGTTINFDKSHGDKLVFIVSFHHMDEHGSYDGWTDHTVTVRPAFSGFRMTLSGRDRNYIKDYIAESFDAALRRELTADERKRSAE